MKIVVGSTNKAKVEAVEETLKDYPHLRDAVVSPKKVSSEVAEQPKSLEETVRGAINRAKNCFEACEYSIGLESGVMEVPYTKSGFMDVCVCAIYDGKEFHIGLSSAWEFPDKKIMELVVERGKNLTEAIMESGFTKNPNIGSEEGAVGIFSKGRLDRKGYTKEALRMALIHLEQFD